MIHYEHQCIHQDLLSVCGNLPIEDLNKKIHFLMSAVSHIQSHCAHLEEVLRANNITMPVKEEP